jgi:hypothetical protein
MTSPPSQWPDRALGMSVTVLAVAVVLYIAAKLIEAVLTVLVGVAVVGLIGYAGWTIHRFRQSRW